MPSIPSINSTVPLIKGGGSHSTPDTFGGDGGLGALSAGLGRAAAGATDLGRVLQKRKRDNEIYWSIQSSTQLDRVFSEFASRPENQEKETFVSDFDAFADQQIKEYLKTAPGPTAARNFQIRANTRYGDYRRTAVRQSEALRLNRMALGIDSQVNDALVAFRNNSRTHGSKESAAVFEGSLKDVLQSVDQVFDGLPSTKRKIQEAVLTNAIIGTASEDPVLARKILDGATVFDATQRKSLERQIESQTQATSRAAVVSFETTLKDIRSESYRTGIMYDPPTLAELEAVYGKDQAAAQAIVLERQATEDAFLIGEQNEMRGKGSRALQRQLASLSVRLENESDPVIRDAIPKVKAQILKQRDILENDSVAYLNAQNPVLVELSQQLLTAPEAERAEISRRINQLTWDLQGPPPLVVKEEEMDFYLGKDLANRNVMSIRTAEDWASRFQNTDSAGMFDLIGEFKAQFGTSEIPEESVRQWRYAINDLVTLPSDGKKLPEEYQVALWLHDSPHLQRYVDSVRNFKDLGSVTDGSVDDYKTALFQNPDWVQFSSHLQAQGPQTLGDVSSFGSGLVKFSMASFPGQSPADAVKNSVGLTLNSKFAFIQTPNQDSLMIARERSIPTDPPRDQVEIREISKGVAYLMNTFDPEEINPLDEDGRLLFPNLPEGDEARARYMGALKRDLRLRTLPDGQGATLYVVGDFGLEMEAVDAKGQPFVVMWDDYEIETRKVKPMEFRGEFFPATTTSARVYRFKNAQEAEQPAPTVVPRSTTLESPLIEVPGVDTTSPEARMQNFQNDFFRRR